MTQGGFCVVKQKGGSTSVAPERMSVPSSNPESVVLDPSQLGPYSTAVTSTHKDSTAAAGHLGPIAAAVTASGLGVCDEATVVGHFRTLDRAVWRADAA